jgi:EAL domain-containing protein (putative c-di-GMP-specific phosphodiesterase class I)
VSSPEIFEACKELGIDYFQGYLFAEPAAEIITKILN